MKSKGIDHFINGICKRVNLAIAWQVLSWILLVLGGVLLIHGAIFRWKGEAVPWSGVGVMFAYAIMFFGGIYFMRKRNQREAALIADRELGLKDSLSTALEFEGEDGEVHHLQLRKTEELVQKRSVSDLPLALPGRRLAVGGILAVVAISLGFLPPSLAVRERLSEEAMIESRTEEIRTELEELLDELLEEMDADEKEVLKPEELKQWVKELKRTKDQKEAMRQLARFEQKVSSAMAGLETREDEETLKLAAAELAKSDQSAARQLGKHLDLKDFKLAEEDLKKAGDKMKNGKPKEGEEKRKLSEEEMKKLREMTRRMADAARKRSGGQKGENGKTPGKMSKNELGKMNELLEDLDDAARDAEEMMGEFEDGDFEKMEGAMEKLDGELAKMRGQLRKMDGKNKARKKLAGLRAGLGKAQQYANGQSQALGLAQSQSPMPGGLKPGEGSSETRRTERDEMKKNDNFTNLEGQQGAGPSITAVEDAESGTGVSGKTGVAQTRDFQRQMESFVRRDDVPEEMKMGVKEYFEKVHEVAEEKR